jgi:hypothetical protein
MIRISLLLQQTYMPRVLKTYGECTGCRQDVLGYNNKTMLRGKLFHKNCPIDSTCSICLENIKLDSKVTPSCRHAFHKQCLENWKNACQENSNTCPECRKIIRGSKKARAHEETFPIVRIENGQVVLSNGDITILLDIY